MSLLDYVKARVAFEGDCWIWQQMIRRRQPEMNSIYGNGSVRRHMWRKLKGVEPRKNSYVRTKCGDPRCVNPDHLTQQTISTVRAGRMVSETQRHKNAMAARAKSNLTMDVVRAIRADSRIYKQIAEQYGTTRENVSKIKRGLSWRDNENPWRGL